MFDDNVGGHEVVLRTGQHVQLRPAHDGDEGELAAFYAALSNETSRLRFFTIRRRLPSAELHRWVSRSLPDHLTLLVHAGAELVGIGELHRVGETHDAEVAFAVADGHHGEGIATLLFEELAAAALSVGIIRFVAETLHDNREMLVVFRTIGCPVRIHHAVDVAEVTIELDAELLAAAHRRRAASDGDVQPDDDDVVVGRAALEGDHVVEERIDEAVR